MPIPRLGPVIGGLLTSAIAKRLGARHAAKLGLALTAWQLWQQYQAARRQATPYADGPAEGWTQGRPQTSEGRRTWTQDGASRTAAGRAGANRRWSGRRP